jgi:DNA-binding transcriptional MerR regulator
MEEPAFSTVDAARLAGLSVRQLDYWASKNLIVPSVRRSHGPGTRRRYSLDDLVRLCCLRQLKRHGWSTQKIRRAVATLGQVMEAADPLRHAILVHGNGTIVALCKTRRGERILLDSLDPGGQQVMPIILEALHEEVRSAAEAASVADDEGQAFGRAVRGAAR